MVKIPLVVANPRAAGLVRDPDLVARIRQRVPAERLFLGRSADELYAPLREARMAGVDSIVVVGGDGTVAGVLTALLRIWPHGSLPGLVLAGGGASDSLARALGTRGSVEGVIERLLDAGAHVDQREQSLLRVRPASSESRYGLSLLGGAPARWLREIDDGAGRGLAGRTLESLRTLGSIALRGERAAELAEPVACEIEVDGKTITDEGFTALAISAIPDLGLAVSPFPEAPPSEGGFRVGVTRAGPARLGLEVPLLTFGVNAASCVDQYEASFVTLRFEEPTELTLDTEPLPPTQMLTVEPGPVVRFLLP